ncbi:MAG TPA: RusA family crossover junction endodeoxyribonuclease [Proteiniclasticum sp.]|uniref:RusA family crossover junction endodeoxyribonuclease n=1 Tax=Proteiniclasticum sp. TaxID=2053595 RepID=UPI000E95C152|nr:RusA family crossover junction endodeoxyribonuclease [Proteiniclasticum sp.]HBW13804.1 RusA family crossover junction endodeoxyribonuclease [Proteiniclasticum sp.]
MIEFFMHMIPPTVTHQQKQVHVVKGKPIFYEPDDLEAARAKLMAHLGQHIPERKLKGPLRLTVKWCFPLIKGKRDGQYKDTKPDAGNSNKLLEDCMEALGYLQVGDQQFSSVIIEKFWARIPGIYIKIEEV